MNKFECEPMDEGKGRFERIKWELNAAWRGMEGEGGFDGSQRDEEVLCATLRSRRS